MMVVRNQSVAPTGITGPCSVEGGTADALMKMGDRLLKRLPMKIGVCSLASQTSVRASSSSRK